MLRFNFGPVYICKGTLAFIIEPKTFFVGCHARRLVRRRVALFIQTNRVAQVAFCLHIRPENDADGVVDPQEDDRDHRNRTKTAAAGAKSARGARRRRRHSSSSCRCCLAFLLFRGLHEKARTRKVRLLGVINSFY